MRHYRCRYQVRRTKGAGWVDCSQDGVVCLAGDWFCATHAKVLARAQGVQDGQLR